MYDDIYSWNNPINWMNRNIFSFHISILNSRCSYFEKEWYRHALCLFYLFWSFKFYAKIFNVKVSLTVTQNPCASILYISSCSILQNIPSSSCFTTTLLRDRLKFKFIFWKLALLTGRNEWLYPTSNSNSFFKMVLQPTISDCNTNNLAHVSY